MIQVNTLRSVPCSWWLLYAHSGSTVASATKCRLISKHLEAAADMSSFGSKFPLVLITKNNHTLRKKNVHKVIYLPPCQPLNMWQVSPTDQGHSDEAADIMQWLICTIHFTLSSVAINDGNIIVSSTINICFISLRHTYFSEELNLIQIGYFLRKISVGYQSHLQRIDFN